MGLTLLGIVLSFCCVLVVLHCLVILLTLVSFDFVCVRYVCRVFVHGRMSPELLASAFPFSRIKFLANW